MKQGLLAAAFLVTSAGFASADYVIIVANVGGGKELRTGGAGMAGMQGMRGGMMNGMQPGMSSPAMPAPGMQPGMSSPAPGMQPGMSSPAMPNQGGAPPMGMRGGARPGMPGGMMGMPGGMMGMFGGASADIDVDDLPQFVFAVVEVKPKIKDMAAYFKKYEQLQQEMPVFVELPEHLGKTCQLLKKPSFGEMFILTEGKDKPLPTVSQRYKEEYEKTMKGTPAASDFLHMAEWALTHGLLDKFAEVMDKLVETDKKHPSGIAFVKVKAELARALSDDPSTASWRGKLLPSYKVKETPHYLIVHNESNNDAAEVTTHAEHLENTLRGFYYWFALKQKESKRPLPTLPRYRQVAIVTNDKKDFDTLREILTPGPVVVDGFFARRENTAVMTSQRQDDSYEALQTYWKIWSDKGFKRGDLLNSTRKVPKKGVPLRLSLDPTAANKIAEAQMLALMLKVLEQEAELATVSHDASRQLLFASGLLPRNVAVPEWILFGMGSFFETPLQSPWRTMAGPSPYYLHRWRELKNGGLEKTRLATLRRAVTDSYFHAVPSDGKDDNETHLAHEAALRKARTVSWSLTYYLAQQQIDGLRRYFTELSKMPRDLELDEGVLLGCFARAFGCVDANNKVDDKMLSELASKWYTYMQTINFDSESTMKEIRETIAKKLKEAEEQAKKQRENAANGNQPGMFPGGPGGFPRPGGGNLPGGR